MQCCGQLLVFYNNYITIIFIIVSLHYHYFYNSLITLPLPLITLKTSLDIISKKYPVYHNIHTSIHYKIQSKFI